MTRRILALSCVGLTLACGAYRIQYEFPSRVASPDRTFEVVKPHGHAVGPLLIGGGGFFFLLQPMSPALIDYTGEVDIRKICPSGSEEISRVEHHHNFGQNALAALISWFAIVNWYHQSHVVYQCVRSEAPGPTG